jgi:hypothetical protein
MATATAPKPPATITAPAAPAIPAGVGAGPPSSVNSFQREALLNAFSQELAQRTGLNATVIKAWASVENAYASNGTGYFNFLNVRPAAGGSSYSGVPLAGTSSGNFQEFGSLQDAVTETAYWINNFGNYAGIRAAKSQPPTAQLAAIAASPWDQGRYSGGGPLVGAYFNITKSGGGLSSLAGSVASSVVDAAGNVNDALGHIPGVAQTESAASTASSAVSGAADAAKSTASAISWLSSWGHWARIGYVLAGGVLVLGGIVLLARAVGGPTPSLPALPSGGGPEPGEGGGPKGPISEAPKREQKRAGFTLEADKPRPKRGAPGSSQLAKGDEIPF